MSIKSYSKESIQQLLDAENIQYTTPPDPIEKLAELWIDGFVVVITHETEQYVLTPTNESQTNQLESPPLFIRSLITRCKIRSFSLDTPPKIQKQPVISSLEEILDSFLYSKVDYLYFRDSNSLVSFSDNLGIIHRIAQKKVSQLESQYAMEKVNLAKKEQMIRALKYDLREYKIAIYIPGMSWIGKLGKLIEPRLGKLYQYHPRHLATPECPLKRLSHPPKISIVTPSFEQGDYLEKTLQSVLGQDYSNLEYVVKDGGSKDNSRKILELYENRLSSWISEPDSGQSQAINLGFANTTGEIMAWLNSDDLLLPGALTYVADYFNTHPDVDVIYGNRLLIDENDMEIGRWILPGHSSPTLSWADFVPQETMFWRRRIWDKIGGQIDESFRFAMDWDLLIRFREAGAKFAHLPYFIGAFRVHEHQKTTAANDIGLKETKRIQKRIFGRVPTRRSVRIAVIPFVLRHIAVNFIYLFTSRLKRKQYKYVFPQPELIEEDY